MEEAEPQVLVMEEFQVVAEDVLLSSVEEPQLQMTLS
jgi:hypothetical protein